MLTANQLQAIANPNAIEQAVAAYFAKRGLKFAQEKSIANHVLYHGVDVEALTSAKFFGKDAAAASTDTNWGTDARRPEGEHMLITAIRALEGANASVKATAWTEGISTADLMNGNFEISVNGTIVLAKTPLSVFTEADENPYAGYYFLDIPIVWEGQSVLEIETTFPVAPAATNQNLRLELHGLGLVA